MADFDFRAAIARRPGGATQAELIAAYGNPLLALAATPVRVIVT